MSFETINLIKIDLNSTSIIKFNIKKNFFPYIQEKRRSMLFNKI